MLRAVNYWAFPGGLAGTMKIEDAIDQAAEAGFEGIELCVGQTGELTDTTSSKRCSEIVQYAKKAGIKISSLASGVYWGLPMTSPDASVRQQSLKFLKGALRVTSDLGAQVLLTIPGYVHADFIPDCQAIPYDKAYERAVEQIREAAKDAEKLGVVIGIENVWNKFLWSPLEFTRFLDDCGSGSVKAYYDVSNTVAFGDTADWIRILGSRIARVHFKEYKKRRNQDGSVSWTGFPEGFEYPLGSGDVNFPVVIQALKKVGYDGPVTYEYLNFNNEPGVIRRLANELNEVLKAK